MEIPSRALWALATILALAVQTHAEEAGSRGPQFNFAWSIAERALAKEALSRLPPDLPRIDRVITKIADVRTELTVPETITLGLALSRYYDPDDPEGNATAQDLRAQISGRSAMPPSATFGFGSTDRSSAFFNGSVQRVQVLLAPAAVTYYFSPFGRDSNDCKTILTPCQTIAKVNSTSYNPGDNILFQGGQSFTGCLVFSYMSNVPASVPSNPIIIGSYGLGNATILSNCPGSNSGGHGPKSRAID
jgi:hypothetical protein